MAKDDALTRFTRAAEDLGISVEAVRYPEETRTAAEAAAAIGCDVAQIVKSLVITTDDGPMLAFTAGHHRVDLTKLAGIVGGDVRMATADEARTATGYSIGGTPPFGHQVEMTAVIDPSLLDHELVHAAAGAPDACFPITPDLLVEASSARPADFVVD